MGKDVGVSTKEVLQILKIGIKMKVKSLKVTNTGVEVEYFEPRTEFTDNSKRTLNKRDREELEYVRRQAEIDELRLMDPLEYEEKLASGEITD